MRKRAESGIITVFILIFAAFFIVAANYFKLADRPPALSVLSERSELRVIVGETRGTIYDCNMRPIVNVGKNNIISLNSGRTVMLGNHNANKRLTVGSST